MLEIVVHEQKDPNLCQGKSYALKGGTDTHPWHLCGLDRGHYGDHVCPNCDSTWPKDQQAL